MRSWAIIINIDYEYKRKEFQPNLHKTTWFHGPPEVSKKTSKDLSDELVNKKTYGLNIHKLRVNFKIHLTVFGQNDSLLNSFKIIRWNKMKPDGYACNNENGN